MKDESKNIIRRKANDFNVEPDVGDWQAIEQKLNKLSNKTNKKRVIMTYIVAAAIAILLVVGGLFWLNISQPKQNLPVLAQQDTKYIEKKKSEQKSDLVITKNIDENAITGLTENIDRSMDKAIMPDKAPQQYNSITNNTLKNKEKEETKPSTNVSEENIDNNKQEIQGITNNRADKLLADNNANNDLKEEKQTVQNDAFPPGHKKEEKEPNYVKVDVLEIIEPLKKSQKNDNYAVSLLFASNAAGSNVNNSHASGTSSMSYVLSQKQYLVSNLATSNYYDDVNHNFPLSFGLSVRKNINQRFAVETGVSYTYLRSVFLLGSIKKTQDLHYVGIPLLGIFTIKNFSRFSVYLSAGAMVEKNIAGRLTINSLIADTKKNKFTISQLQWSINAHVGLNYQFYKGLSFYIEPGWTYYFDNGNGVDNFHTKYPSSFNFQAGFRFSF
ncbi:MAG: porin family protein [Prevotellaceae bacterium]|jgi:hypothetical protein|nr:porin family protein [Prevotellaceae bacterium]